LNGTHQILFCANDIKILSESINTTKENTEALLEIIKETGLEVNAKKTKLMYISYT